MIREEKNCWKIELLGVRGSMAVTPSEYREFGSDTLCVRIEAGETVIFLDAGSGIMYGKAAPKTHILIGHPHLDHLVGLCKWNELADPSKKMTLYMAEHGGQSCEEILHALYGPPFWPVHLEEISKGLEYKTIDGTFTIGGVTIETLDGNHPGGVTHFKLTDGKRSVVYAVDCELTSKAAKDLEQFAKGCDLLICDGQLTEEDAAQKRGWGHSTLNQGASLGERCGAKETVLVHFDPFATDEQLRALESELVRRYPKSALGRQGEIRYV